MIFGRGRQEGGPDPAKRWFVTVLLFILRKLASALAVMFTVSLLVYLALEVNVGDVAVKVLGQFNVDQKQGGNSIEYRDEDPQIRKDYIEALKKEGAEFQMPESVYR